MRIQSLRCHALYCQNGKKLNAIPVLASRSQTREVQLQENESFFIRVWKPFSSIRFLKTLRGSSKGKVQKGQYLLAVDLD